MSDDEESTHPFEDVAGDSDDGDADPIADSTVDTDTTDDEETGGVQTKSDSGDDHERELEKWEDRLDQREEGLDLRAEKLKDRAEELDTRESDIEAERADLEDWRTDLEDWEARLEQREQDLDDREAAIREREAELAERATDLDEKEQTLHHYVGNNLAEVESAITETVQEAVSSAAKRIEPGEATVDQESLNQTIESAIDDAMADHGGTRGRFGTAGNILIGLIGLVFVVGGATVLFATQTDVIPRAFSDTGLNYGAAAILVFIGLAINLSAAADRI